MAVITFVLYTGVNVLYTGVNVLYTGVTFVLYTGVNVLERVSPRVIVLDPPEKLVLETRASGGYREFEWIRNGNPFMVASGRFPVSVEDFSNFFEIFVRDNATVNDLGVYDVELVGGEPQVPEVDFTVTPYSEYVYVTVYVF